MTESEKIQVLLKEYETLRTEIIQRCNHRFHFLTIIGAVGGFIFFKSNQISYIQISAVVVTVISIVAVWLHIGNLIAACSMRISEIEKQVNELAGQELLRWETTQIRRGVFHRFHRIYRKVFTCQQEDAGDGK